MCIRDSPCPSTRLRSPTCCTGPATGPRWSARPTSSRSSTRSSASPRTPSAAPAPSRPAGCTAGSNTWSWPPTAESAPCTMRSGWPPSIPMPWAGSTRSSTGRCRSTGPAAGTPAPPRSRPTPSPAGSTTPTGSPTGRSPGWTPLGADEDWFCWMSFPDPHHPWDPPESEVGRIDWREVPLPAGYPEDRSEREAVIDGKPRHWRLWYDGTLVSNYEAPATWVPATLTPDQVREVNARNAVECELVDEALGRVLGRIGERGWADDVDVVFTSDHGELQGDFGLLFKGPYHVDALMRLPLVWRPAPSSSATPSVVTRPVGLVDLAPTFCTIAGIEPLPWMQGGSLPMDDADAEARGFERVLTEWDSDIFGTDVHLRTIMRDRWVCTAYLPGTSHDGTEGELYDLVDDPLQRHNRWDDPAMRPLRDDLVDDLWSSQPPSRRDRLVLESPV